MLVNFPPDPHWIHILALCCIYLNELVTLDKDGCRSRPSRRTCHTRRRTDRVVKGRHEALVGFSRFALARVQHLRKSTLLMNIGSSWIQWCWVSITIQALLQVGARIWNAFRFWMVQRCHMMNGLFKWRLVQISNVILNLNVFKW